jgi:uncharacterized protein YndB with AHSA1/START domain
MTQPAAATAEVEVTIEADPDKVYALITDLPTLASLGDEIATMEWRKGTSAQPGAVFKGNNRNGWRQWSTTCTVTDADPGRVFAFDVRHTVLPISHWRYDIEPVDGGCCRVTGGPGTNGRDGSRIRPGSQRASRTARQPTVRISRPRCNG